MISLFDFDVRAAAVDAVHAATALYTTPAVVDAILDDVGWPAAGKRLLDPSCGDGSFLVQALARIECVPGDFESLKVVRGWEFHPGAVADARERVANHLLGRGWSEDDANRGARGVVNEADFLTEGPAVGEFDILCGNPPYLRWQYVPEHLQNMYSRAVPKEARSDMLHAFLFECARLLPNDGVIAFVSADRWLFNESATELRRKLASKFAITHLQRLDPATSFFRPKRRVKGSPPRVHPVKIVMRPLVSSGAGGRAFSEAPISPDSFLSESIAPDASVTLGEIAVIKLAPWLGPVGVFVVGAAKARSLPTDSLVPVVDTDDIDPHSDALSAPTRFAIRTHRDVEPDGALRDHLLNERHRLPPRAIGKRFWMPPERVAVADEPSLLVPRIARELRAVALPAGIGAINHNVTVIAATNDYSLAEIRAILLCAKSQEFVQQNAPRLENGFLSITPTLLRRLPVPIELRRQHAGETCHS